MKITAAMLLGMFALLEPCSAIVTLRVTGDAEIRSDNPIENYGTQTFMSALANRKAYIKFDASGLDAGVAVTNISSFLLDNNDTESRVGDFFLLVGTNIDNWAEETITWNNAPGNDASNPTNFLDDAVCTSTFIGNNADATGQNEFIWGSQTAVGAVIDELNSGDRIATIGFRYDDSGGRWVQFAAHENTSGFDAPIMMLETDPDVDAALPVVPPEIGSFAGVASNGIVRLTFVDKNDSGNLTAIRVYRQEVPDYSFPEDRWQVFQNLVCSTNDDLIYEGSVGTPATNGVFEYVDTTASYEKVYAYWAAPTNAGGELSWAYGIKIRRPELWWSEDRIRTELYGIQASYSNVSVEVVGNTMHESREMLGITVGDAPFKIGLIGAVHAGESGPELVIPVIKNLLENHAEIFEIVSIAAIPCVNLDGRQRLVEGNPWYLRKNSNGVDINRNFPADWEIISYSYGGSTTNPVGGIYRGPSPMSESETQAVTGFLREHRPAMVFSYHHVASLTGQSMWASRSAGDDPAYMNRCIAISKSYTDGYSMGDAHEAWNANYCIFTADPGTLPRLGCEELGIPAFDLERHDWDNTNSSLEYALYDEVTIEMLDENRQRHTEAIVSLAEDIASGAVASTITVTHDAEIRGGVDADSNYGTQTYMSALADRKAYIKFDASGLADNALVVKISSFLLHNNDSSSRTGDFFLLTGDSMSDSWNETTITWNNAPGNDTSSSTDFLHDGVSHIATFIGNNANVMSRHEFAWASPIAEDAVIAELNSGDRIATIGIRYIPGTRWVQFATRENISEYTPPIMTLETVQTWRPEISSADDAEIRGGVDADSNYGTQTYMSALADRKVYIKFDVSALDQHFSYNVTVTNIASFLLDNNDTQSRVGDFFLLTGSNVSSWAEWSITWNNAPGNDTSSSTDFLDDTIYSAAFIGNNANAAGTNEFVWASQAAEDAVIAELNSGDRIAVIGCRYISGTRWVQFATHENAVRMSPQMIFEAAYNAKLHDGTPIPWILQYWNGTNDYAAAGNDDLDSMTNYEEYLADTHPKDSNSVLRVESVAYDNGIATVTWVNGDPDADVTLGNRDDLISGSWTNVYTLSAPESTINSYGHTNTASSSFYRVEAQRP